MNCAAAVFCYEACLLSMFRFCGNDPEDFRVNRTFSTILLLAGGLFFISPVWEEVSYFFRASVSHFLLISLLLFSLRKKTEETLLAAAWVITVKTMVWNFSSSFLSCMVLTVMYHRNGTEIISLETDYLISSAGYLIVVFAIRFFDKKWNPIRVYLEKSRYFLSVPLLCLVMVVDIVNWGASSGIMMQDLGRFSLYYNQIFSNAANCLLAFLCMCIACLIFLGAGKIYMEQRKTQQYLAQVMFYQMLHEQYRQMERLRHDMKNHVLSLHGLYRRKEWEAMGDYLEQMLVSGGMEGKEETSGSSAVDALLYHKRAWAEKEHIRWECEVQIPKECPAGEFDLCVLFGNLLDNAVQGAGKMKKEEERFLSVYAGKVKKCFLLVVKNGTDLENEKDIRQGTGLCNVRETVERYQGIFRMKAENHIFEVSILLPQNCSFL